MVGPTSGSRGLTAAELAVAVAELREQVAGSIVLDAALVHPGEDVLLVLARDDRKHFVHIALGSKRARITTTARRFARHERLSGPKALALRTRLEGRTLEQVAVPAPGERRARFSFSEGLRLEVELFSARGLWALVDGAGRILDLSRPVATAVRTLHLGEAYAPPPPSPEGAAGTEVPPRFAAPVLEAIDAHFAPMDAAAAAAADRELLRLAAADRKSTRLNSSHSSVSRMPSSA